MLLPGLLSGLRSATLLIPPGTHLSGLRLPTADWALPHPLKNQETVPQTYPQDNLMKASLQLRVTWHLQSYPGKDIICVKLTKIDQHTHVET